MMAAATRVLADEGAEGLTMQALAKATGLSRATLYRRTGGREALLDLLAAQGAEVGDRTATRARILVAARAVFSREGFEGATVEEIAREAKVGLATVYRAFGDKEGLVGAFLSELAPRRAAHEGAARPSDDLRADLTKVAERMLLGLRDDAAVMRLMLLEGLRGGPFIHRVRAVSPTRTLPSITRLLEGHARAGRLPADNLELLAQAFSGLVMAFGVLGPILGDRPMGDPVATARALTSIFLDGALRTDPPRSPESAHAPTRRR